MEKNDVSSKSNADNRKGCSNEKPPIIATASDQNTQGEPYKIENDVEAQNLLGSGSKANHLTDDGEKNSDLEYTNGEKTRRFGQSHDGEKSSDVAAVKPSVVSIEERTVDEVSFYVCTLLETLNSNKCFKRKDMF